MSNTKKLIQNKETAMGKHNLNAQSNNESEYVRAVTRLVSVFLTFSKVFLFFCNETVARPLLLPLHLTNLRLLIPLPST